MEIATAVLKRNMITVFKARDVNEARHYLDSVSMLLPERVEVEVTPVVLQNVRGSWFDGETFDPQVTVLYFHGGGYSFYPRAYVHFIAQLALAMKSRIFALDYSLAPEHHFPTQLEEALSAYRWLRERGVEPANLVVAGDSAGGNLALAVLLAARDQYLPLPALAIALSPPLEIDDQRTSMVRNHECDWIEPRMLARWADWFCTPSQRRNPLVSPLWADLSGLPPIYLQAGRAEILYDSIRAFADRAQSEGRDVILESYADMNHDFQIFGGYVPQSAEALRRLGEIVRSRVHTR